MDFFKSVFSNDGPPEFPRSPCLATGRPQTRPGFEPWIAGGAWSYGGLIKTLATRSKSMIESYRRDLEQFKFGLWKEMAVIREAASCAFKDLPTSLEVGASAMQESLEVGASATQELLESVGQAINDIGATMLKSMIEILSHDKEALLNLDSDSYDHGSGNFGGCGVQSSDVRKYSRLCDAL